jgi:hypothetical protein
LEIVLDELPLVGVVEGFHRSERGDAKDDAATAGCDIGERAIDDVAGDMINPPFKQDVTLYERSIPIDP